MSRPTPEPAGNSLPRRVARQEQELTLRIRVELMHLEPKVWRRLELGSHLMLDEVHDVLQTAFGWTDSHLYLFRLGDSGYDSAAESFIGHFDDEEDDGVPAASVRLDEVLAATGDQVQYLYDFGDNWNHVLELEAVLEREPGEPRARCTDGELTAPPEDSGGPGDPEGWTPEPIHPAMIDVELSALSPERR